MLHRPCALALSVLVVITSGCNEATYLPGGALEPDGGLTDALASGADGSDPYEGSYRSDVGQPAPDAVSPGVDALPGDGAVGADRSPDAGPTPGACSFGSRPMPVRSLRISASVAADRLNKFLRPQPAPIAAGDGRTTADIEKAVREYYGSTSATHITAQAWSHVLPFVSYWLGVEGLGGRYLNAFASGKSGLHQALTASFGPANEGRVGLFSEPSLLTSHSHATTRGVAIREDLLCQPVPPPAHAPMPPPPVPPGTTYRQSLQREVSSPACVGCHRFIDPPGFAFEHFDAMGRYRATENGHPIDASGFLVDLDGRQIEFVGPGPLMTAIASSCVAHLCHARKWLEFALASIGRTLRPEDDASVREVATTFAASGNDLIELVIAVTQSEAFLAP